MTPLGKTLKRAVKNKGNPYVITLSSAGLKVAKVVAWVSSYLGPTAITHRTPRKRS